MANETRKAVVLLSGGIDSATTAAIARELGFELYALTFQYGQRHNIEVDAATNIAHVLQVKNHAFQLIDLRAFGGSALTASIAVPKAQNVSEISDSIPITYVPARNTIFLAFALAYAEVTGASEIFIGVNAMDYSGYPDCRPEYIDAFDHLARLATKAGVEGSTMKIRAPLIDLSKADIIRKGVSLGLDYSLTHSCYDPSPKGLACGCCDSCLYRRKGFDEAGVPDPTKYAP